MLCAALMLLAGERRDLLTILIATVIAALIIGDSRNRDAPVGRGILLFIGMVIVVYPYSFLSLGNFEGAWGISGLLLGAIPTPIWRGLGSALYRAMLSIVSLFSEPPIVDDRCAPIVWHALDDGAVPGERSGCDMRHRP